MSRRKKEPSELRRHPLQALVTEREAELVASRCKKITVSDWLRDLIVSALKKKDLL